MADQILVATPANGFSRLCALKMGFSRRGVGPAAGGSKLVLKAQSSDDKARRCLRASLGRPLGCHGAMIVSPAMVPRRAAPAPRRDHWPLYAGAAAAGVARRARSPLAPLASPFPLAAFEAAGLPAASRFLWWEQSRQAWPRGVDEASVDGPSVRHGHAAAGACGAPPPGARAPGGPCPARLGAAYGHGPGGGTAPGRGKDRPAGRPPGGRAGVGVALAAAGRGGTSWASRLETMHIHACL